MVVETRKRLASKTTGGQTACPICDVDSGVNWLQCEKCRNWVHSACMNYSQEEFKFLEKASNVSFTCNECLGKSSAEVLDTAKAVMTELLEMKTALGEVKQAVQQTQVKQMKPSEPPAKLYSDVLKSKSDYSRELRFSGIPEHKMKNANVNRAENRRDIFEHEEQQLGAAIQVLGIEPKEISSFRRLGPYDPEKSRPRPILVKFTQEYFAEKILARAVAFKDYEPKYEEKTYSIFVSKSLNVEEQKLEQKLLKKRRELLNSGEAEAKDLRIRKGVLYHKGTEVKIEN